MRYDVPVLWRFLAKLARDVLPPALASVIGGILFTHYQLGYAVAPGSAHLQAAPASVEMLQLVRDEHQVVVDFLRAQMVAEKSRLAEEKSRLAEQEEARVADGGKPTTARAVPHRIAVATSAAKPGTPRKPLGAAAATARRTPLAVAQAGQGGGQNESAEPATRDGNSLLDKTIDKTIDIKDHVVGATQRVVAAVGGIPSWIASIGERIAGQRTSSSSGAEPLFTASL